MRGKDQMPELEAQGLCPIQTKGYGNCLFHALADQMYGDQSKDTECRAATINHMRAHPSDFKGFLPVHPGGGLRRNPKRKNPGALETSVQRTPTPSEVDAAFQRYMNNMEQRGEYGDDLTINAFANAYGVNVYVWVEGIKQFVPHTCEPKSEKVIKKLYILHHTYEHFSSIRNISGPHDGPANVVCDYPPPDDFTANRYAPQWLVDAIQSALPYSATRRAISEALDAYKGDMTKAVSALMPASSSSSSRSSSIERDVDPEEDGKPKKKRSSRPEPLHLRESNTSLTPGFYDSQSSSPDPGQLSSALTKLIDKNVGDPDETEEEVWHKKEEVRHTKSLSEDSGISSVNASASDSSAATNSKTGSKCSLKLNPPKKPEQARKKSPAREYDADGENPPPPKAIVKTRRRLITGAERDRLRAETARRASRRTSLSPTSANSKTSSQSPPIIDNGIKDLSLKFPPVITSS